MIGPGAPERRPTPPVVRRDRSNGRGGDALAGVGRTSGSEDTPQANGEAGEPPKPRRAVALHYDPDGSTAPVVSAAGQGLVADEIIRRAREAGVPITEDPQLAAVLSQLDVGAVIPRELYVVVAEVLAYVYSLDKRVGGRRP